LEELPAVHNSNLVPRAFPKNNIQNREDLTFVPGGLKGRVHNLLLTMNTSSVHLRDLDNLVSGFPSNIVLGSHKTNDPSHSTRLYVSDGESSYEEDRIRSHATNFSSKISCPTLSPLQRQSIFDRIRHRISAKTNLLALEKELNARPFGEQWNFNGTELGSLDSPSVTETDLSETQSRTENSLYLISELCDRLAASDSAEKGKHNKGTQTVVLDTPNDSQKLNLNNQAYISYAKPHSQTNTAVSTALVESPYGSYSGSQSDYNDAIENGFEDFLAQCHEPCGTCCEPVGAVSCLEHVIQRISPPFSRTAPVNESHKPTERDIESSNGLTNSSSGR